VSSGVRVPLAQAHAVAGELVSILGIGCERIEVAGSIRRRTADVGDIELVAVPTVTTETIPGLLEDGTREVDQLQLFVETLLIQGTLVPHPTDPKRGPKYSKLLHAASGLQVDLFSAERDFFGLIWLIRTGPAEYSRWLVTEARSRGFHVAEAELHRGRLGCSSAMPCVVVATPDEVDVYRALGIPHTRPEDRR